MKKAQVDYIMANRHFTVAQLVEDTGVAERTLKKFLEANPLPNLKENKPVEHDSNAEVTELRQKVSELEQQLKPPKDNRGVTVMTEGLSARADKGIDVMNPDWSKLNGVTKYNDYAKPIRGN